MVECKSLFCKQIACENSKYCITHNCPLCNQKLVPNLFTMTGYYCKGDGKYYHQFESCLNRYGPKNKKICHNLVQKYTHHTESNVKTHCDNCRYKTHCKHCQCKAKGCTQLNSQNMWSEYCPKHTCKKDCGRGGICNNYKKVGEKYCYKHGSDVLLIIDMIVKPVVSKTKNTSHPYPKKKDMPPPSTTTNYGVKTCVI